MKFGLVTSAILSAVFATSSELTTSTTFEPVEKASTTATVSPDSDEDSDEDDDDRGIDLVRAGLVTLVAALTVETVRDFMTAELLPPVGV